jgi:hypothetical protein
MRNKILMVLPSRRPWQLLEAVASIQKNSSGLCDILVCTDTDDLTAGWLQFPRVMTISGPSQPFAAWVNDGVNAFLHDYEAFMWGSDKMRFLAKGWDELVMGSMTPMGIVYGPCSSAETAFPYNPVISAEIPRALKYLIYPKLKHHFAGDWISQLGFHLRTLRFLQTFTMDHRFLHDQVHTDAWQRHHEADEAIIKAESTKAEIAELAKKIEARAKAEAALEATH